MYFSRLFAYLHHLRSALPSLKLVKSRHDFSKKHEHCAPRRKHTLTISTAWPKFCSRLVQFCTSIQPHTMSIESSLLRLVQHEHPCRPTFLVCQLSLSAQATRHKFFSSKLCPCFVHRVQHFRNQLASLSNSLQSSFTYRLFSLSFHIGNHVASNGTCFGMMSAALANTTAGRFIDGILLTTLSSHSSAIVWLYTKSITLIFWHMMFSFTTLKKNSRTKRLLLGIPHLVLPPSVRVILATSTHAARPRPRTQPPRPRTQLSSHQPVQIFSASVGIFCCAHPTDIGGTSGSVGAKLTLSSAFMASPEILCSVAAALLRPVCKILLQIPSTYRCPSRSPC